MEALAEYVDEFCQQHNREEKVANRKREEKLTPLPSKPFLPFRVSTAKVNKFSLVNIEQTGQSYSVPSDLIGLTLEIRIYPNHVEILDRASIVAKHKRAHGAKSTASVKLEHIIEGLCKKPGAMRDWEHRSILFERPVWQRFYGKQQQQGGTDRDYLGCLRLMREHGRETVTLAMELALESENPLDAPSLENLITMKLDKVYDMKPVDVDLQPYDEFLEEVSHGRESSSES